MGSKTGSLLQSHLNNGVSAFNNDIVKRAKTPMVARDSAKEFPTFNNERTTKLTTKTIRAMEEEIEAEE